MSQNYVLWMVLCQQYFVFTSIILDICAHTELFTLSVPQNISPWRPLVTTLLVHPWLRPLALRQDEPLLSQSQGLRVCPSSSDPFGRPSSVAQYSNVQYRPVQYSHSRYFSQSLEASFNFSNKITNGKLVITLGSNESGDYNGSKTRKAWEVHFFLDLTFCSIKYRTEPILSLMSWSLVTDD